MAPHRVVAVCVATFIAGLLGLSLRAEAQIPGPDGVIYACIRLDRDKDEGRLARLVAADEACRRGEVRVKWNVVGPKGPTGATGAQGPMGPAGANGATGPQGPAGPAGPKGDKGDQGDAGADGAQGLAGVSAPAGAIAGQLASCVPNATFTGYLVHIRGRAFSAFTGPDGAFQIDNLPPGAYTVTVETPTSAVALPPTVVDDSLVTLTDPVQVGSCVTPPVCVPSGPEVCDGIDNNCDGQIDENISGNSCNTGQQGVCAAGVAVCQSGQLTCAASTQASTEVCGDNIDNNCDGQVDEGCTAPLTVSRGGAGGGTVTSTPTGISCGATCAATFNTGAQVFLSAIPNAQSDFGGWSGACTGTGGCLVTMNQATSVTATFTPKIFALTVGLAGTGGGLVTSAPAGINCGASCSSMFSAGTVVTLTAISSAGSFFTGWSGGGCVGTGTCVVSMTSASIVIANFTLATFTLTVTKTGPGAPAGIVTTAPAGIDCGAICSASFNSGTVVVLTPTADAGVTFVGWGGSCSGTGACVVTMSASNSVTANFSAP